MIHAFACLERIFQARLVSSIFVVFISFCSVYSVAQGRTPNGIQPILDFGKKVEHARQELLDVYYDQVKQGLFTDASYVNSLVVDVDLENDAEQNVVVLLRLINWLEQKNDRNSEFLLNKIGRLYFLELHQFLSSLDIHNPEVSSLIGHFHDLCMLQLETPTGTLYPFRTGIAKMSLSIFMINHSHLPYQQRKESIFYALEQVKKELIGINHSLGYRGVQDSSIQSLIYLMGRFAIQEPLIPKRFLGKIIGGAVILGALSGVVYWTMHADWSHIGKKIHDDIVKPAIGGLGADLVNGVLEDAKIKPKLDEAAKQFEDAKKKLDGLDKTINDIKKDGVFGSGDKIGQAVATGVLGVALGIAKTPFVKAYEYADGDRHKKVPPVVDENQAQENNELPPDPVIVVDQKHEGKPLINLDYLDPVAFVKNKFSGYWGSKQPAQVVDEVPVNNLPPPPVNVPQPPAPKLPPRPLADYDR